MNLAAGEPAHSISLLERACDTIHKSIQVIHTWHGHEAWGIYWEHAPEMKPIREEYDRLCAELKAAKAKGEQLVQRPRCQAAASLLSGIRVDHDKGLYPTYCILEEGHAGPHKSRKVQWPNNETKQGGVTCK